MLIFKLFDILQLLISKLLYFKFPTTFKLDNIVELLSNDIFEILILFAYKLIDFNLSIIFKFDNIVTLFFKYESYEIFNDEHKLKLLNLEVLLIFKLEFILILLHIVLADILIDFIDESFCNNINFVFIFNADCVYKLFSIV